MFILSLNPDVGTCIECQQNNDDQTARMTLLTMIGVRGVMTRYWSHGHDTDVDTKTSVMLGKVSKKIKKNGVGLLQPRYVDGRQPTPNLLFFFHVLNHPNLQRKFFSCRGGLG